MSRSTKQKVLKIEKQMIQIKSDPSQPSEECQSNDEDDEDDDENEQGKKLQNSLSILTRRFVELIKTKEDFTIDLNEASKTLEVQKRRIYDITNVMEGVGYVEKIQKNTIRWIGSTSDPQMNQQKSYLTYQINKLKQKQNYLDQSIKFVCRRIQTDFQEQKSLNYIDIEDCQQLMNTVFEDSPGIFIIQPQQKSLVTSTKVNPTGITEVTLNSQNHIHIMECMKKNKVQRIADQEQQCGEGKLKWQAKEEVIVQPKIV